MDAGGREAVAAGSSDLLPAEPILTPAAAALGTRSAILAGAQEVAS